MVDKFALISEIGNVITGTTPATANPKYYASNDYMFIGPADLGKRKYIKTSEKYVSTEGFDACRKLPKNSILVVCIGATIGKVGFVNEPSATNQQINSIVPFENYDAEYIYYLLLKSTETLKKYAGDTATPILNKGAFSIIKLGVIESLPEQKKIAEILSTVDDAIQNTKAQIEKTKELKKGLMQKLFSEGIGHTEFKDSKLGRIPKEWEVMRLGEVSPDLSYGLTIRPKFEEDGIPLISARELRSGVINYNKAPRISIESYNYLSKKAKPKKGDIFLSKTGTIGLVAIYDSNTTIAITQNIAYIRNIEDDLHTSFLLQFIKSNRFISKAKSLGNQSTIIDLQLGDIRKMMIPIPSLDEQNKISHMLESVQSKISNLELELSSNQELKKGLMQKLLSGEVRVNVN